MEQSKTCVMNKKIFSATALLHVYANNTLLVHLSLDKWKHGLIILLKLQDI